MVRLLFLLLVLVCISACNPAQVNKPSVAFSLDEKDLIPEGITYDPVTKQFFLSSINKHKVVSLGGNGEVSDFVKSDQDSLFESLGMKVDAEKRRLWVLSNLEAGKKYFSAVHVFDIDTRRLVKKFIRVKDSKQLFNDLVLTGDGGAFITDTEGSMIYRVTSDLTGIEPFVGPDSLLKWANGIAISPDNSLLYVAAGDHIALIETGSKECRVISNPSGIRNSGIDGLVFHRGSLYALVNGVESESEIHIARYDLDTGLRELKGVAIIDKGNPMFNIPTTLVIAENSLYLLANTCLGVHIMNMMNDKEKLQPPLILKYSLPE